MVRTFCFKCGKETEDLTEGLCTDCHDNKQGIVDFPKKMEIIRCSKCDMAKIADKWILWDPKLLLKKAKVKGKITEFNPKEQGKKFIIEVVGYPRGIEKAKTERHEVSVHFNRVTCPVCSRRLSNYYEAVIQVRWKSLESRLRSHQINEFVIEELERKLRAGDRMAFFRIEEKKEGTDFLLGSKNAAKAVAKRMKERYNAEIKESFILVTKIENEDAYRNVYSVRI